MSGVVERRIAALNAEIARLTRLSEQLVARTGMEEAKTD
jgi:uncharacterized small protein (DUF1192 family)